jgi:hypothetical protein
MLVSAPAENIANVAPDNGADLANTTRALIVNVAGDLHVITAQDDEVTFPAPVGVLPLRVKKVFATGTTATGIVALW